MIFQTMSNHFIRAVLFDLGGTLMRSLNPWEPITERADLALADFLCENKIKIDCEAFPDQFRAKLDQYYIARDQSLVETTYMLVLRELLKDMGNEIVSEEILRGALDRMFAVTQTNWQLEEDARSTLQTLKENGYRLGLVSNAGDHQDVLQLTERFKINVYFDFILTSARCSYRKPHPRIFELALSNWYYLPEDAAMVGDTLEADIKGANEMGIYSIWISRRAKPRDEDQVQIQPDASVHTLIEIPELLKQSG